MLHIQNLHEGKALFQALGSEVRVQILELLLSEGEMNLSFLAARLHLTNGALTAHIKKLEAGSLIRLTAKSTGHGSEKIISLAQVKMLVELAEREPHPNVFSTSIPIGSYCECDVYPTCGLAAPDHLIGTVDDRRYFFHSDRSQAQILWFTRGYVEYVIPNFIPYGQKIDDITLSMGLGSEAPGYNEDWPSDIHFLLDGIPIAMWTAPGDYGTQRGIFTPDWWYEDWNQYGLLKALQINHRGTFIDGVRKSDVTIDTFGYTDKSTIHLRLSVPEDAEHVGGLTIFG